MPSSLLLTVGLKVIEALIEKHGDDYAAMARDHKINTYQHTAKQLRQKVPKPKVLRMIH